MLLAIRMTSSRHDTHSLIISNSVTLSHIRHPLEYRYERLDHRRGSWRAWRRRQHDLDLVRSGCNHLPLAVAYVNYYLSSLS